MSDCPCGMRNELAELTGRVNDLATLVLSQQEILLAILGLDIHGNPLA